jgi:hypothetical protein
MSEPLAELVQMISDVILPNIQAVQAGQANQIAAQNRIVEAIEELRLSLHAQFAHLAAQLTACRAELAATQAMLKAAQSGSAPMPTETSKLIH